MYVTLLDRQSFGGTVHSDALEHDLQRIGVQTQRIGRGDLGLAPEEHQKNVSYIVTGTGKTVMTQTS